MLDEARTCVARRAWDRAYELFSAVSATGPLDPDDLDRFAKAAYWTGLADRSISLREAAYAAYLERGDDQRAALCALTLRREHLANMQDSVAAGWLKRAEHLLEGRPESFADTSLADGYLAIAHADAARARGDFARALGLVDRALRIADGSNDRDLRAWGVMRRAMFLVDEGRLTEGYRLMEEVGSGGRRWRARRIHDRSRLHQHDEPLSRRCDLPPRHRVVGCRAAGGPSVNGSRDSPGSAGSTGASSCGCWATSRRPQSEASRACDEVGKVSMVHAGVAQHELGEVRLRLGDLEGAEEAFGRAQELGEDPQPGLALLRLAQGDATAALASIEGSLGVRRSTASPVPACCRLRRRSPAQSPTPNAPEEHATSSARSPNGSPPRRCARRADPRPGCSRSSRTIPIPPPGTCARPAIGGARCPRPYEAAKAEVGLAEADLMRGDRDDAAVQFRDARATFERLGARLDARRAVELEERLRRGGSPTRTVRTFLFTDIVGSTSLMGVIGDDAWDDLRRWHDQTLRASFVDHGGEEIDHAGDGFFVAFPDATSALASATEIQRRLVEHRRAHGFAPQVRIGLHATSATNGGGDYTGLGVHAAARISALAGAGEILASAETVGDMPDVRTSEMRTAHLKGIAEPVDVVAIEWRD